jgi:hypothetical protein
MCRRCFADDALFIGKRKPRPHHALRRFADVADVGANPTRVRERFSCEEKNTRI